MTRRLRCLERYHNLNDTAGVTAEPFGTVPALYIPLVRTYMKHTLDATCFIAHNLKRSCNKAKQFTERGGSMPAHKISNLLRIVNTTGN